jgi:hypothetical protein
MNERHAQPPTADVRPFLPRPGEPADAYAERLRSLHRDLTLVLDAVERGLSAEPPPEPEPAPAPVPVHVAPLSSAAHGETARGSLPRVEVIPRPERRHAPDMAWASRPSDEPPPPPAPIRNGPGSTRAVAERPPGAAPAMGAWSPAPAPLAGYDRTPPVVVAAALAGWLTVVVLALVLLLEL